MLLTHQRRFNIKKSGVFDNVNDLYELDKAISRTGGTLGEPGSDVYNDFVGAAYEIYAEFFLRRYKTVPGLGITGLKDTSRDKYNIGFDFTFKGGQIQVKYRHTALTLHELGTFAFTVLEQKLDWNNAVLFTNLPKDNVFSSDWSTRAHKQFRVIDFDAQLQSVSRDLSFFNDFRQALSNSCKNEYSSFPSFREHQEIISKKIQEEILSKEEARGHIIVACGGGKTLNEIDAVLKGFEKGFTQAVFVAPTINLLLQHHETFKKYNCLQNINVIHVRTGQEAPEDGVTEITQTTKEENIKEALVRDDKKKLFFVTYASLPKFVSVCKENNYKVDLSVFDEFHHCVKQDKESVELIQNFPSKHLVFFSASRKSGRVQSTTDETLYGKELVNISFQYLKEKGRLVQPVVRFVHVSKDGKHFKGLNEKLRNEARLHEAVDIDSAIIEAAAILKSVESLKNLGIPCEKINLVTFSSAVPTCKLLEKSKVFKNELKNIVGNNALLQTVHSEVKDREDIFENVKNPGEKTSVLLQHSIVKEGIDVTPFNAEVICRQMDLIGIQQALGRIVRASPGKDKAYLYVLIKETTGNAFQEFIKRFIQHLAGCGLEMTDFYEEFTEERKGVDSTEDTSWMTRVAAEVDFPAETLHKFIQNAQVELFNEEWDSTHEDKWN